MGHLLRRDYKKVAKQFVMPSHTQGQSIPSSSAAPDLAVPVGANKALGADWIKDFTDKASMKVLQAKGNIPNTTNLLGNSVNERAAREQLVRPDRRRTGSTSRTATSSARMLTRILTGKLSVKQAATVASNNITSTLNG